MKTFIEARRAICARMNPPRRVEEYKLTSHDAWTGEELWRCVQTHEKHQAWYDESRGLIAYYNTQTGEMVTDVGHVVSSDNRVMVVGTTAMYWRNPTSTDLTPSTWPRDPSSMTHRWVIFRF